MTPADAQTTFGTVTDPMSTLDQDLSKPNGLRPIYLVQGEERLLVDQAARRIVRAAVDDPTDAMAVTRVDLTQKGLGAREVIDACRAIGLFTHRQAVLVRAAEALDKSPSERDLLADYALAPDPATTLILKATKLDGRSSLAVRIRKRGRILKFDALRQWQAPAWLVAQARDLGHALDQATAHLVADLVGASLMELRLVLEQLSLYVGPGKPIRREDVEALLSSTRAHSVFELVDAVGERRTADALRHLSSMLDRREPALRILSMLARHLRMLWQTVEARERGAGPSDVQGQLGVHSFVAKKLCAQAPRFDGPALHRAWEAVFRTELRLKSTGLDDALVLERLVLDLCRS